MFMYLFKHTQTSAAVDGSISGIAKVSSPDPHGVGADFRSEVVVRIAG